MNKWLEWIFLWMKMSLEVDCDQLGIEID
jgi:hypothetical protein